MAFARLVQSPLLYLETWQALFLEWQGCCSAKTNREEKRQSGGALAPFLPSLVSCGQWAPQRWCRVDIQLARRHLSAVVKVLIFLTHWPRLVPGVLPTGPPQEPGS